MTSRPCTWCRQPFTGRTSQKFCSRRCAATHQHAGKSRRTSPRKPWEGSTDVDTAHRRLRAIMVPQAIGTRCPVNGPRCDHVMVDPHRMQLDHRHARALGGQSTRENSRVVCTSCNHWLGSRLGGQVTRARHGDQRRRQRTPEPTRALLIW